MVLAAAIPQPATAVEQTRPAPPTVDAAPVVADVVVYGGTPGGIMAAVAAARAGVKVVLVEPRTYIGGMMSNGLSWTDVGDEDAIGGLAREFFDRTEQVEGPAGGWRAFQPSTADAVFAAMLSGAGVTVLKGKRLLDSNAVTIAGARISEFRTTDGSAFRADVFIDASYEGDLMAKAGISHRIGRESKDAYGESRAGVRPASSVMSVPPGMDPGFPVAAPGPVGSADNRIQNSNYRVCVTTDAGNRVPFPKPGGYDPARYEIVVEYINQRIERGLTPHRSWLLHVDPIGGGKLDLNEAGSLSFGLAGANQDYPTGSWSRRAEIDTYHRIYQKGFLYFITHDLRVPPEIRLDMARFGLCADEFTDNGNWPRLLYLREGRRLVGSTVVTQHDVQALVSKPDTIGLAAYRLDAHQVSRWIAGDGRLLIEGSLGSSLPRRWSIPYRSITPRSSQAVNLLVPVAASASHVAYASLRMEPQYMIMGQAAGAAAAIASVRGTSVQAVPIATLQARLRSAGAVLDDPGDIANTFYTAISWAYYEGITSGCAPGLFCPNAPLPRGQMAALLARALDLPAASGDYFVDDEGSTHEANINRVAEAGITFGCAPSRFCPDRIVTRGEMASFLVRAFSLPPTMEDFFTDDEGSTHEININRLAASGITTGCTATTFCPNASVTRGQTLAFLYRIYDGGPSGGVAPTTTDVGEDEEPDTDASPSPSPSPSESPSPSPTPTPDPAISPSASPSPTASPGASPTTPEPTPTTSPVPTGTPPSPSPSP